ncbi:tyrosine-type recombinase/integrase [Hungatella sp.]
MNQGLNAHREAFSPAIIIEELLLQRFLHTLHEDRLSNVTPHTFRHTFCTNMDRGMNPNTLQYIMGHSNITMTLGYYAHGSFISAKAEIERLSA